MTNTLSEKQQLEWCQRERATVYFGKEGVKVKVHDFNPIKGATLQEAIAWIEKFRRDRLDVQQAVQSLRERT